jgi:hypothetical protein
MRKGWCCSSRVRPRAQIPALQKKEKNRKRKKLVIVKAEINESKTAK